ncbi:MAG: hypothetical protein ACRENG_22965, partial [bacterium]
KSAFNVKALRTGNSIRLDEHTSVSIARAAGYRSGDLPLLIELGVSFGAGVVSSVVASWLYDLMKGKPDVKVIIENEEINIDERNDARKIHMKITRILQE